MPIRRDNPFEEIEEFFDRMRHEFEEGIPGSRASLAVDLRDIGDEFVMTADVPGFEKEDIDVTVADSTLRVSATHEELTEETGEFLRRERRRDSIERSLQLPEPVDEEAVEATYANGVLTITLPKRDADGGTQIDIK